MSTTELVNAIIEGDAVAIQTNFEAAMAERIAERLDAKRFEVAQSMFKEAAAVPSKVSSNALHVQQVRHEGKIKYKVHAVGKNFASGIKVGEHLSDAELDNFHEMGGKVKLTQEQLQQVEEEQFDEEMTPPPAKVHPNAMHVQHAGGGKYKVHAVGSNFAHGVKVGEHLSDTDLDDFQEMGGKIKHVK